MSYSQQTSSTDGRERTTRALHLTMRRIELSAQGSRRTQASGPFDPEYKQSRRNAVWESLPFTTLVLLQAHLALAILWTSKSPQKTGSFQCENPVWNLRLNNHARMKACDEVAERRAHVLPSRAALEVSVAGSSPSRTARS